MTEPLDELDLSQLAAPAPPREEKEPFLYSVTKQTPWCLYSVMFHVLIVALIGMIPLLAQTASNREEVMVLVDPGPKTQSEFYSSNTNPIPIGGTLPGGEPAPQGPLDLPSGSSDSPPDIIEYDNWISPDPSPKLSEDVLPPLIEPPPDTHLAQQSVELIDGFGTQPSIVPKTKPLSFRERLRLLFREKLNALHSRFLKSVGQKAGR